MEEGLKTADPHDFSTYTGWTGEYQTVHAMDSIDFLALSMNKVQIGVPLPLFLCKKAQITVFIHETLAVTVRFFPIKKKNVSLNS